VAAAQAELPCELSPHLFLSDARRAHDVPKLQVGETNFSKLVVPAELVFSCSLKLGAVG
jgi:hypothetical protein